MSYFYLLKTQINPGMVENMAVILELKRHRQFSSCLDYRTTLSQTNERKKQTVDCGDAQGLRTLCWPAFLKSDIPRRTRSPPKIVVFESGQLY